MSTLHPGRFVVTAVVVRQIADAGPLVLVLAGEARGVDARLTAALLAAWTLPQVVTGPLVGVFVDQRSRPLAACGAAGVTAGALVLATGLLFGRAPYAVVLALVAGQALCEPMLTGALSGIATRDVAGRIEHWDSVAYNAAGLAGPAVVTGAAALGGPPFAAAALGLPAMAVAALLWATAPEATAPVTTRATTGAAAPVHRETGRGGLGAGVRQLVAERTLRATTIVTTASMAGLGGLSLAAVALAQDAGRPPSAGGLLLTVAAVGGLLGSLASTRRARIGRPDVTCIACVAAMAGCLALAAVGPWPVALAAFFAAGAVEGPLLVATFVARSRHTSPHQRAAVFAAGSSLKIAASALGALLVGAIVADAPGPEGLLAVAAVQLAAAATGIAAVALSASNASTASDNAPERPSPGVCPHEPGAIA